MDLRWADKEGGNCSEGLDPDERAYAARIADPAAARRWRWAHAAMRRILAGHLGHAPEALWYRRAKWGRPQLIQGPGMPPVLDFSLTHSGEWAWLAIARGCSVGIDLEEIKEKLDWRSLVAQVCAPAEVGHLQACPEGLRSLGFHRIWVRKEAVLKAEGVGLGVPCGLPAIETLGEVVQMDSEGRTKTWWLRDLPAPTGYVGALACSKAISDVRWHDIGRLPTVLGACPGPA